MVAIKKNISRYVAIGFVLDIRLKLLFMFIFLLSNNIFDKLNFQNINYLFFKFGINIEGFDISYICYLFFIILLFFFYDIYYFYRFNFHLKEVSF